jgi:hypothetical protein
MPKIRSKVLTTNSSRINSAMEDIKRFIDGNARGDQKVHKIEDILDALYE